MAVVVLTLMMVTSVKLALVVMTFVVMTFVVVGLTGGGVVAHEVGSVRWWRGRALTECSAWNIASATSCWACSFSSR